MALPLLVGQLTDLFGMERAMLLLIVLVVALVSLLLAGGRTAGSVQTTQDS
jgi:hypothetical protein